MDRARQQRHHPYSDYGTGRPGRRSGSGGGGRGGPPVDNGYMRRTEGGAYHSGQQHPPDNSGRYDAAPQTFPPPDQSSYYDQGMPNYPGGDYAVPQYDYDYPRPSYSGSYDNIDSGRNYNAYEEDRSYAQTGDYAPPQSLQTGQGRYGNMKGRQPQGGSDQNLGPERRQDRKSLIDARVEAEKPCRTLFVRNVEYTASSSHVRGIFERHGDVKKMYDMLEKRGMAFITFFDIRASQQAKEATQDTEVNGRKIDVHYSLPKETELNKKCDADKDQGTLFLTLKNSKQVLHRDEVEQRFAQYGELKSVRPYTGHPESMFVEYYDSRACVDAHDAEMNAQFGDGRLHVSFVWDLSSKDRVPDPRGTMHFDEKRGAPSSGKHDDRRYGSPPGGGSRNQEQRYGRGSRGDFGGGYGSPPLSAPSVPEPNRLEQAQKVQQLLSALASGGGSSGPPPPPTPSILLPPPNSFSAATSAYSIATPMPGSSSNRAADAIAKASSSGGTQSQQVEQLLALLAAQNKANSGQQRVPGSDHFNQGSSKDPLFKY